MKSKAQEEARQRAAKAKAKRHHVFAVDRTNNVDADYVPPMLLKVGIDCANNTCIALLDSGAAVNVMAEHVFRKFAINPLTPTYHSAQYCFKSSYCLQGHGSCFNLNGRTRGGLPLSCHKQQGECT